MLVKIDSVLRLTEVSEEVLKQIKAELTMKNPDYIKKKRIGLNRWAWGPEYIKVWSERDIDGKKEYILPRGYYARLWEIATDMKAVDARVLHKYVSFPSKPSLRDYQKPAIDMAFNWQQGCVIMPCGAGKTETALAIVESLRQPTLWITHTMDLLKQSMDRAISRLGLTGRQIGVIQGTNMSIGSHITFATVQTLSKRDLTEIKNRFGCVIIDESHLVFKDVDKSRMFESVISQLPAFYRFGMTASEHRSDGLIDTMFHVIGPKIYEVSQEQLNAAGNVMVPKVQFIDTDFTYDQPLDDDGEKEMLSVQQMYKAMGEDPFRDECILKILAGCKISDSVLVLGHHLSHLEGLCEKISGYLGAEPGYRFISGETKKLDREKALKDVRDGKAMFLFATYQLAKLGLDLPRLNVLVLSTPAKDQTTIQQAVGRIMRPSEGKSTPIVYDIWDKHVPQLVKWARERVKVYRSLGASVVGGPKVRGGK